MMGWVKILNITGNFNSKKLLKYRIVHSKSMNIVDYRFDSKTGISKPTKFTNAETYILANIKQVMSIRGINF